ncbi:glycoside hydrolase family 88 protein [Paenibacillus sp. PsM32]|uniref:glycoside hydrolase family 88 protein n=1 Tax=Paenibacillus sp. PsM32 TaxID=3030536 RepID=UPI00263B5ED5|nr:glycoside hydrolase family 88 protein [Paenibacillus sp. PsM32]MDN4617533.1 glycoside hydrolase family 88 protein [Paenibacillus sp. PsM32]
MIYTDTQWLEQAWEYTTQKLERTRQRIGATFPNASFNGQYDARELECWTNGFWPGILWLYFRETGDRQAQEIAQDCEVQLDELLHEFEKLHHDNGFLWSLTSVANYKLTGNHLSRRRALIAASHLAGRFNLKGHFIRAWLHEGSEGLAIIDCMMNLALLYWASETTGDPRFRHIAKAHSDMTIQQFVRQDGSVHHIVRFDPETGELIEGLGGQGYDPDSAWSRGTSWAIYGFAIGYRYTGDSRYLQTALDVADFWISQTQQDRVPPWDFRAPDDQLHIKDSTAAACAASGMLELAYLLEQDQDSRASIYRDHATATVESLFKDYTPQNDNEEALIIKGTASYPARAEVEVPIIYGDYFFLEALAKLKGETHIFW